jgi:DNA primase
LLEADPTAYLATDPQWRPTLPATTPGDFTIATMPARFAALGDLHAGIDDAVFSIEPLLEWADRDARNGADDRSGPAEGDLDAGAEPD